MWGAGTNERVQLLIALGAVSGGSGPALLDALGGLHRHFRHPSQTGTGCLSRLILGIRSCPHMSPQKITRAADACFAGSRLGALSGNCLNAWSALLFSWGRRLADGRPERTPHTDIHLYIPKERDALTKLLTKTLPLMEQILHHLKFLKSFHLLLPDSHSQDISGASRLILFGCTK